MSLSVIYKLVNFAIFAGIIIYFVRRPVTEFFRKRSSEIGKAVSDAEDMHANVLQEEKLWNERMTGMASEIDHLTKEIRTEGELERLRIIEQARRYAAQAKQNAVISIGFEKSRAIDRLKRTVLSEAVDIATERLSKETTEEESLELAFRAAKEIDTVV